jgi:NAD(P)H dehydrogenase (quinone)
MKIVVIGSSGYIGQATVGKLLAKKSPHMSVIAVTRDIEKDNAKSLSLQGATILKGDMADPKSLNNALNGATAAYIVVPGHENRTSLALNALEACKNAKVGFVLLLSICAVERKGEIFADQFKPIEEAVISSGLKYCIIRMPMFLENIAAQSQAIRETGKFYTPINHNQMYNSASIGDLGEAAANILSSPSDHDKKIYNLVGQLTSEAEVAQGLSDIIGKRVEHVQVPCEAAKQSFMSMGFPEWQTDGIIELMKGVNDEASICTMACTDTTTVLGRPPVSHKDVTAYLFQGH